MLKTHFRFFILCILLVVLIFIRFHGGLIQQDNYVGYAESLAHGLKDVSFFDSRLFPGLPIIIYIVNLLVQNNILSGYLAVFLAFIGSYIILYKLTGSKLSFLPLVFPPAMLNQLTLVATEMPVIFFILLSLFLFNKKKYALAVLVSGFGFWIRAIAIIPSLVILAYLFIKNRRNAIKYLPYFFLPFVLLVFFNSYFFGSQNLFQQFTAYRELGVNAMGLAQILIDIPRAYRWGWYRIFASGVFYFSLSLLMLGVSFLEFRKRRDLFEKIVLVTIIISLLFVYSLNSVPFLENLGRYLAPVVPLFWIIFYKKFKNEKILYFLIPLSALVVLL